MSEIALETEDLTIGYPGARHGGPSVVAANLSLELDFGEVVCLVGPNGAGKSTLLRTISGLQPPLSGQASVAGRDVRRMGLSERARSIAVVLTERAAVGLLTAFDLVALGRHPHIDWAGRLAARDRSVIEWALESVGAADLRDRFVQELSDGERQKVMIARALAQEPAIIILDEPTAFLDLPRRVEILGLMKELARSTKRAVLLSTHDLDLAIRTADRLWLMGSEGAVHAGAPEDLVISGDLACVFHAEGVAFDAAHGSFHIAAEPCGRVALTAPGLAHGDIGLVWTRRALARAGYEIGDAPVDADVSVRPGDAGYEWHVQRRSGEPTAKTGGSARYTSIYEVIAALGR